MQLLRGGCKVQTVDNTAFKQIEMSRLCGLSGDNFRPTCIQILYH